MENFKNEELIVEQSESKLPYQAPVLEKRELLVEVVEGMMIVISGVAVKG